MKKATFGLIGTGGIAQSQHLPNLTRAPNIRLKTICDLRRDVVEAMQKTYAVENAVTEHKRILEDKEIDAVVIASKEDAQVPLTIEALRAGKHVYVEKPLAESPERCAEVVAAERETGRHVVVGFNRRFAPAYLQAKNLIDAHGGAKNIYYRISDEYWSWGKNNPPGVRVIHEVCHVFDILRWFTGSNVVSLYTATARADDEIYTLTFANGAVATIMNSGYATMDMPKEHLEIIADKGGVFIEDFSELTAYGFSDTDHRYTFAGHTHPLKEYMHKFLLAAEGADALRAIRRMAWELREKIAGGSMNEHDLAEAKAFMDRAPNWNYMVDKGWRACLEHFARCIVDGKKPDGAATAADALTASALAQAAIRSRTDGIISLR
ncbi:MAG: Gfo/Idh/MocA family oxidoreductase [Spirochaetota bacterium]